MPYVQVEDFKLGLDLRKSSLTAPNGSVRELTNCHITAGGEVEKRLGFPETTLIDPFDDENFYGPFDLTGTHGLAYLNGLIVVFGYGTAPPTLGAFIFYQSLSGGHADASGIKRVVSWDIFEGGIYVVIEPLTWTPSGAPGGEIETYKYQHYYNGSFVPTARGKTIRTYKSRVYGVLGKVLYYSALNDPTVWETIESDPPDPLTDPDGGFIDISTKDATVNSLTGMEVYYGQLALFSDFSVIIFQLDEDPAAAQLVQILRNIGAYNSEAIVGYGNGDVMFLSSSGIRSLRSKDINNSASVNDIGSPLDVLVLDGIASGKTPITLSIVNPVTGRLWITIDAQIYILSYYANTKITAWSVYDAGFTPDYVTVAEDKLLFRDANDESKLYTYGGPLGTEYDNSEAVVTLPLADANDPATFKMIQAIDATLQEEWAIELSTVPETPDLFELVATADAPTLAKRSFAATGYTTHFALRFKTTAAARAIISNAIVHYNSADTS